MDPAGIKFDMRGVAGELLERLLAVPVFQRSYAWEDDEIQDFWDDLLLAFSDDAPEYFLGTIVLTRQGKPPRDTVIDGQQRLATTTIRLAAIRDEYTARKDAKRAAIVQQYLSTPDLASADEAPRLIMNSDDAHFFEQRTVIQNQANAPGKKSHELILNAYKHFRTQITQ